MCFSVSLSHAIHKYKYVIPACHSHAHTIVLLTSLVPLYIVFSRLAVNHTTSNKPPPHHLILLLLHTIQLALTLHAFFPVHATLYKNIVSFFSFGVNLVHVSARASLTPAQFSITFDTFICTHLYIHEHGSKAPVCLVCLYMSMVPRLQSV